MRTRRDFIMLLGGAATIPLSARAQQAMPVIGFLHSESANAMGPHLAGFHRGLKEGGFIDGQNLTIEFRWAEGHVERLPALAADDRAWAAANLIGKTAVEARKKSGNLKEPGPGLLVRERLQNLAPDLAKLTDPKTSGRPDVRAAAAAALGQIEGKEEKKAMPFLPRAVLSRPATQGQAVQLFGAPVPARSEASEPG